MVDTGYDPARIDELAHRTLDALDALRDIRSNDPAASDALRVMRLVRRNLEDLWMPAIREIQRSDVMVSWTSANLSLAALRRSGAARGPAATPAAPRSVRSADVVGHAVRRHPGRSSSLDRPAARRSGRRVRAQRRSRRTGTRTGGPRAAQRGVRPTADRTEPDHDHDRGTARNGVVPADVRRCGRHRDDGAGRSRVDRGSRRLRCAVSVALDALVADPAACLDLLLDTAVLFRLASWERLDQPTVTRLVSSGLSTAVDDDPARLGDGYEVLRVLVTIADGPLDHGMNPGMARGVAASLDEFVDTLAPAVFHTGAKPVEVERRPAAATGAARFLRRRRRAARRSPARRGRRHERRHGARGIHASAGQPPRSRSPRVCRPRPRGVCSRPWSTSRRHASRLSSSRKPTRSRSSVARSAVSSASGCPERWWQWRRPDGTVGPRP